MSANVLEPDVDPHLITASRCPGTIAESSTSDEEAQEKPPPQTERIHAVPVHRRPDLLVPCADLVNAEWQRSQAARVHSLRKSCSEFPVCLVLLQGGGETERLLGHARLSLVVGHGGSLFVESVVVSKAERGRGYGRTLMEETERYARRRGFRRLCLTTHDKQHFYAHLGYVLSAPVQNAGAMTSFVPMEMLLRFSRMPSGEAAAAKTARVERQDSGGASAPASPSSSSSSCPPPPPPPPPSVPPPPPPPPPMSSMPPPPPLPSTPHAPHCQSAGQLVVQTLNETPYRDAKGVPIYWMHKDLC